MPGRALQGSRHREVQNPVTPLTGGAYAEIISTKGLTAHQKNISVILETAGSEFQSRRRRCRLSLSSISNQVNHALAKVTWDKEQIEEYKVEHGVTSVKKSLRPDGEIPHNPCLSYWESTLGEHISKLQLYSLSVLKK